MLLLLLLFLHKLLNLLLILILVLFLLLLLCFSSSNSASTFFPASASTSLPVFSCTSESAPAFTSYPAYIMNYQYSHKASLSLSFKERVVYFSDQNIDMFLASSRNQKKQQMELKLLREQCWTAGCSLKLSEFPFCRSTFIFWNSLERANFKFSFFTTKTLNGSKTGLKLKM